MSLLVLTLALIAPDSARYLVRVESIIDSFDRLEYRYDTASDRLLHIDDEVPDGACASDIDDQETGNYAYDAAGRLVRDDAEGITEIGWSGTGKVLSVSKPDSAPLGFAYDGLDRRIAKTAGSTTTLYVRHPDGRILATYRAESDGAAELVEHVLYAGTTRLGARMATGESRYELVDQVGSVLAVVSGDGEVAGAAEYEPFGMIVPGRESGLPSARFAFGGYEKDDELKGLAESYVTQARFYDPRVGRWLSPDPLFLYAPAAVLKRPLEMNPYAYAANNPVRLTDETGESVEDPNAETKGYADRALEHAKSGELGKAINDATRAAFAALESASRGGMVDVSGIGAGLKGVAAKAAQSGKLASAFSRAVGAVKKVLGVGGETARGTPIAGKIEGFTRHGLNQTIARGVKPGSVLDAIKNPLKVKEAHRKHSPRFRQQKFPFCK